MMTSNNYLLFFDTFSHESTDTIQLDLVQFPRPVQVSEVRVIPLGARVKADFPGGVRLGATNPSQFEIEYFVNDLSKRGAATFENIGNLDYSQHGNIQLEFDKKPPTDGLLLRGNYNTITLAVYGSLTKVQREPSPPKAPTRTDIVPQPPPEKVNTHERIRDWLEDTKRKHHAYEINPSEEEPPDWESKAPRSPGEFEEGKEWRETPEESVREHERERERREGSREKARSREKSWERSERGSSRRESVKRDGSRDKERDQREKTVEREKDTKEPERESKMPRRSRERFEDDLPPSSGASGPPFDGPAGGRRRRSVDEWEEGRRSEDRSVRRPRTPPAVESPLPPPCESPLSEEGGGRGVVLPPPILSDEMEAISDDEDIPDLPAEDPEGVDFVGEPMEEEEPLDLGHPPIDEVNDEIEGCEYEEIMSDEDDLPEYQYEEDYLVEEWEDWLKPFVAQDIVELPELRFFRPPSQTQYLIEAHLSKTCREKNSYGDKLSLGNKLSLLVSETALPSLAQHKAVDADLSQDVPEETGEIWVQAVEQAIQLLPQGLVYQTNENEMIQTLFTWVDCGLDFDMALNQHQPVFKIRHMKAGIRLCSSLFQCSSGVTKELVKRGVLTKLFILNDQPHLALSIRLLILRAIDTLLCTPSGLSFFVVEKETDMKTGYEKMLQLLPSLQQSRAKVAAAVIVRKIHLLEICEKFRMDVLDLVGFANSYSDTPDPHKSSETTEASLDIMDVVEGSTAVERDRLKESSLWTFGLPCSLLQSIVSCLKEILRMYTYAMQLLVQPIRWLPGSKQFQLPKHQENPFLYIYNVFEMSGMLESVSVLLATPATSQNPTLLGYIKSFLQCLLTSEHGLRYLACDRSASLVIIKALLQFGEDGRVCGGEGESLFHLGIQISSMIHVLHELDSIAQLGGSPNKRKPSKNDVGLPAGEQIDAPEEPDFLQASVHFNSLESLLATPSGKEAVVSVIGMPKLTKILFPYLNIDLEEDLHESNPSKAACFGYAVDLLTVTIKYQDNARFLECLAEKLHNLIVCDDKLNSKSEDSIKLCEILPWLTVAKNPDVFTYDKLASLCNVIQDNLERLDKLPGELVTTLRILCHLTIPKTPVGDFSSEDHNNELIEELKYKYATMQLFSSDLQTHLINLLSKLFGMYQQPFLHSSNFVGSEGGYVVMLIKPTLALLDNILSHVIQARNTDFKDLTAVVPLVQTYILLQAFPVSSPYFMLAQKLKQNVITILLGYTQVVYTTEGEEVLSKSLWTQMMAELFKFLMNAPHTMVSVITLITELLPLPLPIQTQIALTEEETLHAIRVRKLWSAHLYSLAATLHELIHRLALATNPLLTHSLRRMCVALSDLSAPMALLVAKATLDLLLQTHRLDQRALAKEELKNGKEDFKVPPPTAGAYASQQTTRALNMLASLVSHAPTKAAVLHLLRGGAPTLTHNSVKSEEKYSSLVSTWCGILNLPGKKGEYSSQAHLNAQECLIMIIHYLLDYENAMQVNQEEMQEEMGVSSKVPQTGVPHKDTLLPFIEAMTDVIRSPHPHTIIIRQALRVLLHLMEHNYGFFYVKSVLDKKKGCLFSALRNLSSRFSKVNLDCYSLLRDILYFCHSLIYPDEERRQTINIAELSLYLGWKNEASDTFQSRGPSVGSGSGVGSAQEKRDGDPGNKVKKEEEEEKNPPQEEKKEEDGNIERTHPLKILEHLVVSEGGEEEEMEHLYDEVSMLINLLEREGSAGLLEACDLEEPPALGLESLHALFASRIVWTFPSIEDDLHSLWFAPPSFEDFEEKDAVSVNLLEICRKYAGDFNLLATLHKVVKGQASHSISPQKMTKVVPKHKPNTTAIRPNRRGRPYIAPMRGRSFDRHGINIRSDPFRSRPPNTSRPPSLHVDDFVALEITGHQPTGPTGYNKISFGRGKMMLDNMRGRGRSRGEARGRFFHRPPFRGEGGRGMGRGIGMRRPGWAFRGDGSPRGNFRGAPMNNMPPRFIRGRPFNRGGPGAGPGSKDRFPPKYLDRGRRESGGGRHLRGFR